MNEKDLGKLMRRVFNEGFTHLVLPKFEDIDKRFDRVEERLQILEEGQGRMELMLQQVVRDSDGHSVRITKLEKSFGK